MHENSFFDKKRFWGTLLIVLCMDVISLAAYTVPSLSYILIPLCLMGVAWLVIRDIRWGLLLPLLELAWGSFGASLALSVGGINFSLRMIIFLACLAAWVYRLTRGSSPIPSLLKADKTQLIVLGILLMWSFIRGAIVGHDMRAIFFDGNGYLFLLLLPLWYEAIAAIEKSRLVSLLMGAVFFVSVKTIVLFHVFANQYEWLNVPYLYLWLRDTRIGEITPITPDFFRIFMQSQVYIGIVLIWCIVYFFRESSRVSWWKASLVLAVPTAALAISFSRSYWLGIALAFVMVFALSMSLFLRHPKTALRSGALVIGSAFFAAIIIGLSATTPFQRSPVANLFLSRVSDSSDPAGISRLQLLSPLLREATRDVVLGRGFGAPVTYFSSDPRIQTSANPTGRVTTFAFEWGYLDQLLKFGAVGLGLFLAILVFQFYRGWRILQKNPQVDTVIIGLLGGLFFIMVVHVVSPYLNHPLGLGYSMLTMVILSYYTSTNTHEKTLH